MPHWCRVPRRCVHGNMISTLIHAEMGIRGYHSHKKMTDPRESSYGR